MYQGFPDSLATPFSTTAPRNPSFTPACDVAVRLMVHAGSRIYRPPRARRLSVGLVRAARRPTRTVRSFSVAGSLTARRTGSSHRHSRHEHHESPTYNFSDGARRSLSSRGWKDPSIRVTSCAAPGWLHFFAIELGRLLPPQTDNAHCPPLRRSAAANSRGLARRKRARAATHPLRRRRVPWVRRRDAGPPWLSRSPRRLRFSAAVAACLVPVGRRSSRRAACRCCALASRRPGAASAPFRRAHTTRRDGQRAGRACGTPDQPRTTARHQQRPLGESRESTCESRESREFACGGRANCANFRFANTRGIHGNTRGIHEIHVFCFFIYLIHVYDSGDSDDSGDSAPPSVHRGLWLGLVTRFYRSPCSGQRSAAERGEPAIRKTGGCHARKSR